MSWSTSSSNAGGFSPPPCPKDAICPHPSKLQTILWAVIPIGALLVMACIIAAYCKYSTWRADRNFAKRNPQFVITVPAEQWDAEQRARKQRVKERREREKLARKQEKAASGGMFGWLRGKKESGKERDVEAGEFLSVGALSDAASFTTDTSKTDVESVAGKKEESAA